MEFRPLKDFLQYIKYPTRRDFINPVSNPLAYVSLLFVAAFFTNILAVGLVNLTIVNLEDIGNVFDQMDYGFLPMFGLAVIVAPVIEELIFRLPLKFKTPLSILIGLIVAGFIGFFIYTKALSDAFFIFPTVIFVAIVYFLNESTPPSEDSETLIDRYFPFFFYLVAMTFAYIHIYNYDSSQFSTWMIPFIVIPQFVLALFLGFVRIRIGLWASIYMHALNNFIPLILFFSLKDMVVQ